MIAIKTMTEMPKTCEECRLKQAIRIPKEE